MRCGPAAVGEAGCGSGKGTSDDVMVMTSGIAEDASDGCVDGIVVDMLAGPACVDVQDVRSAAATIVLASTVGSRRSTD